MSRITRDELQEHSWNKCILIERRFFGNIDCRRTLAQWWKSTSRYSGAMYGYVQSTLCRFSEICNRSSEFRLIKWWEVVAVEILALHPKMDRQKWKLAQRHSGFGKCAFCTWQQRRAANNMHVHQCHSQLSCGIRDTSTKNTSTAPKIDCGANF